MSFPFGFRRPKGGSTLRDRNAQGGKAAPPPRFCLRQNARTAQTRRRPEGRVGAVLSACREFENIQIVVTSQYNDNPNYIIQVGNVFGFIISIENVL